MLVTAIGQQTETKPFRVEGLFATGQAPPYPAHDRARACLTQALSPCTATTELEEENQRWRQPGAATSILTEQNIDSLERLYVLRRRGEVVDFLSHYPFLVALLQEACGQIETYFDSYRQMILEVVTDPEAVDDRELVLFIQTDLPPAEALDSLHRLDKHWWLEASRASRGNLCVHVEYR